MISYYVKSLYQPQHIMASIAINNNNVNENNNKNNENNLYAYLFGLKNQSSYNYHVVQILSTKLFYDNVSKLNERIPVKLLSLEKRLSAKVKNLKLFKYVSINELVNGTIIQEPIPMLQTNLPDTIKLVDIIDLVENEFELPQGLGKYIASFLTISEMVYNNVKAIGCSSTSKQFEISEVLNTKENTWWISNGRCPQWVEFEIDNPTLLRQICIKIPALPYGPLSVRQFKISILKNKKKEKEKKEQNDDNDNNMFIQDDRILETLDTEKMQIFALEPPILLHHNKFRIECLTTAKPNQFSVGYFSIQFA